MPLPFLIAGGAALLGAGAHMMAKETNEEAEKVSREAQRIYKDAKSSLESAKSNTEEALLAFGYAKMNVLETSLDQFIQAFERIRESKINIDEEDYKFMIDKEDVLKLRQMSDIYSSTISSSATGAAAGALIGLAASGSLSIVTGGMSIAGMSLLTGDIVGAATIAGSSLSLGLSFTPLATIVAPVVLFTGISANAKADENLEKAKASLAEAKKAVEQMKISETMCNAITKRSDMFRNLLLELNKVFSVLVKDFDEMTEKKFQDLEGRKIDYEDLTQEENNLTKVTCSFVTAIKSVINVPLLKKEGTLTSESQEVYDEVQSDYNKKLEKGIIKILPKKEKIFCTGCGKEIMSDVKFCNYCGKKNTYGEA